MQLNELKYYPLLLYGDFMTYTGDIVLEGHDSTELSYWNDMYMYDSYCNGIYMYDAYYLDEGKLMHDQDDLKDGNQEMIRTLIIDEDDTPVLFNVSLRESPIVINPSPYFIEGEIYVINGKHLEYLDLDVDFNLERKVVRVYACNNRGNMGIINAFTYVCQDPAIFHSKVEALGKHNVNEIQNFKKYNRKYV